MKSNHKEKYLNTVKTIVNSKLLDQYLIGLTCWDATKKGDSYDKIGFEHFVTIASPLTAAEALELEEYLFKMCTKNGKNTLLYKKYHDQKRDGHYHPSLGGKTHPDDANMLVYMTWWNK